MAGDARLTLVRDLGSCWSIGHSDGHNVVWRHGSGYRRRIPMRMRRRRAISQTARRRGCADFRKCAIRCRSAISSIERRMSGRRHDDKLKGSSIRRRTGQRRTKSQNLIRRSSARSLLKVTPGIFTWRLKPRSMGDQGRRNHGAAPWKTAGQ